MRGAPHCDPYEAFKACKFLGVGINYLNDNLQIFLNEEYLKPDESRTPYFTINKTSSRIFRKNSRSWEGDFMHLKEMKTNIVELF
jgi:hypothetical protein